MIHIAAVKFSERSMPKYYVMNGMELKIGDYCICPLDKREEIGFVTNLEYKPKLERRGRPLPSIIRKADKEDIENWRKLKEREENALNLCRQKARDHNLVIKVTDVRFDDKNNKIIFHFTADKRVDFRELVRDLASALHSRIELWQIGVRDEARQLDGMGICGLRLCCANFLREFQPVTIRLAKNQDIFLSPNKLSGCCGRLMCCLAYEEEQYRKMAGDAPCVGDIVTTEKLTGTVIERNLISKTCVVQDNTNNKYTVSFSNIVDKKPPAKEKPQSPREPRDRSRKD